jgi:hypothetical protein
MAFFNLASSNQTDKGLISTKSSLPFGYGALLSMFFEINKRYPVLLNHQTSSKWNLYWSKRKFKQQ